MTEEDLKLLAKLISSRLADNVNPSCSLSEKEQHAVRELLNTKKNAIRFFLYIFGALTIWAIKDIYVYLIGTISFK